MFLMTYISFHGINVLWFEVFQIATSIYIIIELLSRKKCLLQWFIIAVLTVLSITTLVDYANEDITTWHQHSQTVGLIAALALLIMFIIILGKTIKRIIKNKL